jgi:cytidine deaminase
MMKSKNISFTYSEYGSLEELDPGDRELLLSARKAAENAYAPYSHFKVGAAVRLESGVVISGGNVENAAFPSGICAERNALANASSNHPGDKPVALAIAASTASGLTEDTVSPCGNCRQVIAEEEMRNGNKIRVILGSSKKVRVIESAGDLLPMQFNRNDLEVTLH